MKEPSDLNQILSSPQAAGLLKDKKALEALMRSGEAQRLMELLNRNGGGGLKHAAQSAMKGDSAQLMGLVEGLMKDPEGAKLAESLSKLGK